MGTFKLPDLGEGLAEAEILEWHVKPGDLVTVDQPMVSVETAKAVVEVPAPVSGTVVALHGDVGDIISTGAPLIDFDSGTVVGSMPVGAEEEIFDTVTRTTPSKNADSAGRRRALPAARALARHLELDLRNVEGSGPEGRIGLGDVLAQATTGPRAAVGDVANDPLRGARRAMAYSMSLSRNQVAASTVFDDADIHGWRHSGDYMLRLIRAMARACAAEPALNAWYDAASTSRILKSHVDLAIAVDTPGGLIVPVLRNVGSKPPEELRAGIAALKAAAHERTVAAADLRDFTLMLSNFGTLAGRYGIPLVVPPAVAILGAGKVRQDVVVVDGAVVAHRRIPLSLSFDHRCVTGGEACRFLAAVMQDLEKPD